MNDERTGASAAEDALRQLRRRYDALRTDYESLLLRLTELEERSASEAEVQPAAPTIGIYEHLLAPLGALRDEYLETLTSLERIVNGIEDLLPRGMKGQRRSTANVDDAGRIQLDVRGRGPRQLLEFRERIAALEGVDSVSIHAIDSERAVLVVELA